jgi:hypothetical protein
MGDQGTSRSALPWAVASFACTYASAFLQWLYAYYHWQIVFAFPHWEPPEHIHEPLFAMFGILKNHGVAFALAAILLAIVSTMYRPRWIGVTALVLAGYLFFGTVLVVQ